MRDIQGQVFTNQVSTTANNGNSNEIRMAHAAGKSSDSDTMVNERSSFYMVPQTELRLQPHMDKRDLSLHPHMSKTYNKASFRNLGTG
mmetsp:Transcript_138/g.257  ORF Transcript_138/g.257 Transcript_138/m.257 type:complete len:88 (-) Transcript_138:1997-2260(-)